jgi:hypothetical protein
MNHNCIVSLSKLSGNASEKKFASLATSVRATILPASNELVSMYPDVPIGQSYLVVINSNALTELPAETEILVTDAEGGALAINDKFQVREVTRKQKVMGNTLWTCFAVKIT